MLIVVAGQRGLCDALKRGLGDSADRMPARSSAHFSDIGDVDGAIDGFDATGGIGFGGFGGFFDRAGAFDDDLAFGGIDEQDGSALAFVVAGGDFYLIAFFDVGLDAAHGDGKC